ncbi:MAG: hypothetical protein WC506_05280 [Candidatus Micrarchaeia archaeon]
MKCYYHHGEEAIGVCSNCFKAICEKDAMEQGGKLICRNCSLALASQAAAAAQQARRAPVALPRRPATRQKALIDALNSSLASLSNQLFPKNPKMQVKKEGWGEIVVPIFFGGMIGGLFAGIPGINLLVFITVPFGVGLSLAFLRAEEKFEYAVSAHDGVKIGIISALVMVFMGAIVGLLFNFVLSEQVFYYLLSRFPDMTYEQVHAWIAIIGLDPHFELPLLQLRFFVTLVLYPAIGALAGGFFAKKMR